MDAPTPHEGYLHGRSRHSSSPVGGAAGPALGDHVRTWQKRTYGLVWGLSVSRKNSPCTESFCHVIRLHCGTAALLLGCAERSEPQSRVRRAEGAGLDRECADRVTMSLPRRTNDFYFVGSPSINVRRLAICRCGST